MSPTKKKWSMFLGPRKGLEISPDLYFFQNVPDTEYYKCTLGLFTIYYHSSSNTEEGRAKTIYEALYKLQILDQCIIAEKLLYSEVIRK